MSIHQLTTLAGTASKPYLLRGNQQVTDQIHYGAAPAAGGSRAGGGLAGPGRGGGDGTDSFGEKTSPSGYSGWRNQPQVLGQRLGVVKLFFFSFARDKATGMLGELRAGSRCGWVPVGTLSLVGARGRPPPQEKKGISRTPSCQSWREGPVCQNPFFIPPPRIRGKSCPRIRRPGYFSLPFLPLQSVFRSFASR